MSTGTILDVDDLDRLRSALQAEGEGSLSERFELSRTAILRAASGLPVLRSTAKAIRLGLEEMDDETDDDDETDE